MLGTVNRASTWVADLATIRREAHKLRDGFPQRKHITSTTVTYVSGHDLPMTAETSRTQCAICFAI